MTTSVADLALLGQLFEEYRPRLLAMLERRIDPKLAVRVGPEEILHEAFIDASRKWSNFRSQSGLSTFAWLYRIAWDRLIETWRRETRGPRDLHRDLPLPELSSMQLGLSLVASGTSPSDAAARDELQCGVRQAMSILADDDQNILWMRNFEHLSFDEIGQVLDVSANAANVRYFRALNRLKDCWLAIHPESDAK